ncbi:MAG: hypothetical protein IPN43_17070 [Chitinophagaceae bacterium]|nr:hypothetical protein [Chitinophagaceae bacterium]
MIFHLMVRKLVFVSRGELFVSDVEGKFIQQLNRRSAERVVEVKWMSDNNTPLFNQTLEGYTNLVQHSRWKRNDKATYNRQKRTAAVLC